MIPIRDLFESHLTVSDLQQSMSFFGQVLGLEIAQIFLDRMVAFYWMVVEAGPCWGYGRLGQIPNG
jgi:lactoylglutathione lyase